MQKGSVKTKSTQIAALKTAKIIAKLASDKKAEDIVVLDMRKIVNYCEFFVICSATSDRHVKAIADNIEAEFTKDGKEVSHSQTSAKNEWVIFDTGDVVTHIFEKSVRDFYKLEHLWQDAKKLNWENSCKK